MRLFWCPVDAWAMLARQACGLKWVRLLLTRRAADAPSQTARPGCFISARDAARAQLFGVLPVTDVLDRVTVLLKSKMPPPLAAA